MKRNRRVSKFLKEEDTDPLSVVVNLFDVAMVFAVALMVAMVMHMNMTEVFGQEDFTIVKNPGKENMEIISKEGKKINTYKPSGQKEEDSGKRGRKVEPKTGRQETITLAPGLTARLNAQPSRRGSTEP